MHTVCLGVASATAGAFFIFQEEKNMKKITALLTAVLLAIATCLPVLAGDDTGKISVTLRIEGINGNISCKTYTTGKTNMAEFIKEADAADDSFAFTIESSAYGDYVAAVNGENAGTFGGYDGWCFLVNGELPPVGMSSVTLEDGDSIVFYYSCDGMQIQRKSGSKGFPLTRCHFRDATLFHNDSSKKLFIIRNHIPKCFQSTNVKRFSIKTPASIFYDSKCFWQKMF